MKKALLASAVILFLLFLPQAAAAKMRLGFRIFGGLNYLEGGDLNRGCQGFVDYREYEASKENHHAFGKRGALLWRDLYSGSKRPRLNLRDTSPN